MPRTIQFLLIAALALAGRTIFADDKQEAKKHFKVGVSALKSGYLDTAIFEMEKSIQLFPSKSGLFNLGVTYRASNRNVEALEIFNRMLSELDETLDDKTRAEAEKQIQELTLLTARLMLDASPEGALIKIDGKKTGTAPQLQPSVLSPGPHKIEVSMPGRKTIVQSIELLPGNETTLSLPLEELPALLTIHVNEAGAAVSVDDQTLGLSPLTQPAEVEKGLHTVTAEKAGFKAASEQVELIPEENREVALNLEPIPPLPQVALPVSTPKPAEHRRRFSPIFWSGIAGTVVFAGLSAGMWGAAVVKRSDRESKADEYNSNVENNVWNLDNPNDAAEEAVLRNSVNDLTSKMETYNKIAVGMTIATGACAVLAVAGIFFPKKYREASSVEVSLLPIGVQGRF